MLESRGALSLTWCYVVGHGLLTEGFPEAHNNLFPDAVSGKWARKELSKVLVKLVYFDLGNHLPKRDIMQIADVIFIYLQMDFRPFLRPI